MKTDQLETPLQVNIMTKPKAFVSLMKLRLSSLVVLSAFFGFLMAKGDLNSLSMYSLLATFVPVLELEWEYLVYLPFLMLDH